MNRGFLTIAYGTDHYMRMAKCMAKSIRLRSPEEKIAIVTDSKDDDLDNIFDVVIPLNFSLEEWFCHVNLDGVHKVWAQDKYTEWAKPLRKEWRGC